MAIQAQLFDGTVLEFPDGTDPSVIQRVAKEQTLRRQPQKEAGLLDRMGAGTKSIISNIGTGIESLVASDERLAEIAQENLKRQQEIARERGTVSGMEEVAQAYEKGLLPAAGEFISQVPGALAEQVPQTAGLLGSTALGAAAGSVVPGIGNVVGGILGAGLYLYPQFLGSNVTEQAAADIERGEEVDIERGKAIAGAVGQAAVEGVGGAVTLGSNLVRRVIGGATSKEIAEKKLLEAAQRSLGGTVATGAARGLVEVPVEVAQEVISRAQSDQDLLSEDALASYGESAYGALQAGPAMGALSSPLDRSSARKALEQRGLSPTGEQIGPVEPTPERRQQLEQEQQTANAMREIEMQELQERQKAQGTLDERTGQIQLNLPREQKVQPTATVQGAPLPPKQPGFDQFGRPLREEVVEEAPVITAEPTPLTEQLEQTLDLTALDTEEAQLRSRLTNLERTPQNRPEATAIRTRLQQIKDRKSQIDELKLAPVKAEKERAVKPDTVLTNTELVNAGLPKVAGYVKQLSGLDLAEPNQRTQAAGIIARAMENPRVPDRTKANLQALYDQKVAAPVPEGQQAFDFGPTETETVASDTTPSNVISDATFDDLGIGRTAVIRKNNDLVGLDVTDPENAPFIRSALETYRDAPNRSESIKEKIDAFLGQLPQVETVSDQDTIVSQEETTTTPEVTPEVTGVADVTEPTTVEPTTDRPTGEPSVDVVDVGDGTTTAQETAPGGVSEPEIGGLAAVDAGTETDVVGSEPTPDTVVKKAPGASKKALQQKLKKTVEGAKEGVEKGKKRIEKMREGAAKVADVGDDILAEFGWGKPKTETKKEAPKKEAPKTEAKPKAPKKESPKAKDVDLDIDTAVTNARELADKEEPSFKEIAQLARNAFNSGLMSEAKFKTITKDIADRDPFTASYLYDLLLAEQSGNNIANATNSLRVNGDMAGAVTPELEATLNVGDVKGALRAILDNDTAAFNDREQLVAKRILDESFKLPTLRMVDSLGVDANGDTILGQFNSITDEISLVRGAADSHTFLHELIHAYVHRTIIDQEQTGARKPAFKDLQDVYNHVKKERPDLAEEYGMQSLTEFASEAMSNREFQMQLMGVPYKKQSIFSWFARALRDLLGLDDAGPVGNTLFTAMVAVDGLMHSGRELQIATTGQRFGDKDVPNVTTQAKQNVDTPLGQPLPSTLAEVAQAPNQVLRTEMNKFAHSVASNEIGYDTILRQKTVDVLAPIAEKLNKAFSNGVKNSFGDVNPLAWLRQTFDHQRIALQMFKFGGLRMNKDGFWEAFELKDSNGKPVSAQKLVETINEFAKKEGTTYPAMKARISTVLEGMRLKDLREYNQKLETLAREQAATGDIDTAFKTRQEKFALHMTNAEIDALVEIFNKTPEIKEVQRIMNTVRANLVDAMIESGRITKEQGQSWKDAVNYVPFDRLKEVVDNTDIVFARGRQGIAALARLPELKGSFDRPVTNVVDGFMNKMAWLAEQSMRNSAVVRTLNAMVDAGYARKIENKAQVQKSHLVLPPVYQDGKPILFEVQNEYDFAAFAQAQEITSSVLKAFGAASKVLRTTITATPMFAIKQVFDDAQRVIFYSGVKNPFAAFGRTLINLPRILFVQNLGGDSRVVDELERLGIVGDYDFNPLNPAETIEMDTKAVKRSPVRALIHTMEKVTKASDMAARLAVYEQTMKETGDSTLAHTRARELINFNRRGTSKTMQTLTHIVPFFNSWAQGTDLLYRGFTGVDASSGMTRKAAWKMFTSRIAMAAVLGTLYAGLMGEDEEYANASDEVRDRAWILPKGLSDALGMEQSIKIPVPLELGFIFKSIPERIMQYYRDSSTGEAKPAVDVFLDTIKDMALVYGTAPIPALVKPIAENYANFSTFTGRALVPPTLQNRPKPLQYTASTSEFARWLGEQTDQSPILIDNALRGYFGLMWASTSMVLDGMMNPSRPARNLNQLPFLSIGLMAPVGSRTKDEFYDFREKVAAAVAGKNALVGDPERLGPFLQKNQKLLDAAPYVNEKLRVLRTLRVEKKFLADPVADMTPAERRARLTEIEKLENEVLSDVRKIQNYFR
jgi:hypothetical protein